MARKGDFTVCSCGNWAFNFRIQRNDGMCAKCGASMDLYQRAPPWRSKRQSSWYQYRATETTTAPTKVDPAALLEQLASLPQFTKEVNTFRQAQEKYKESQAVQASPQECYTRPAKELKWKADALERASKAKLDAEHKLEVARETTKFAALEHARAKKEHADAVARVAAEANIQHVPQGYTSDGKRVVFAVDDTLFQDIGAFDEEEQRVLRALEATIKEKCEQVAAIQQAVHEQFAKVKDIRSGATKRQRTGEQGQSAVGTGGTTEYDSTPEDQRGDAKSPVQPNEDTPDLLAAAEADRAAALEVERKRIASNAKAGGKGHKFRGPNEKTLIRLASFLSLVKEPWLVMGDWNMHPSEWSKTTWLEKLDALVIIPSNGEVACNRGRGTLVDYAIAKRGISSTMKLSIVPEVPWKTHAGMVLEVMYAKVGWWHRALDIAKELPTVKRPTLLPDPESKRQRNPAEARAHRQQQLDDHLQEAFGNMQHQHEDSIEEGSVPFSISHEVWEQARMLEKTQDSCLEENRELTPHFLPDRDIPARGRLASSCASWATTLEEATIITHKPEQQEADKVRGRAKGFAFRWERTRATPDRPHLRDPVAEWWNICSTLVIRAGVLRQSQRNSDLQAVCSKIEDFLSINYATGMFTIFHDEDKFKCWLGMVTMISELDDTDFSDLQQMTNQFLSRAIGRSLSKANKSFQQWVTRMWKSTPGVIHRYTRGVLDKDSELITADHVYQAASSMNANKSKGIDAMGPVEVQRLPLSGAHQLGRLLNEVEEIEMWPPQVNLVI
ncbi:unnamed protein product, partial [Prorocentrum cordatum]